VEKAAPLWQAWPQVTLASFCLILAALFWTVLALQWTSRQQHATQQAEMSRVATRLNIALNDVQHRASAMATMASKLLGEARSPSRRTAVEASLQTAFSVSGGSLDGIRLVDPAGRSVLTVGEVFATPAPLKPDLPLPALIWDNGALLLAGRLPPAANRPGHAYQAACARWRCPMSSAMRSARAPGAPP